MTLHIAIGRGPTGNGTQTWAGQVMDNGQPAQLKTAVNTSDMGCCPVRLHTELSELTDMLLQDWRAAERHAAAHVG